MILAVDQSHNQHKHTRTYTDLLYTWSGWSVVSALNESVICYICAFPCKTADHCFPLHDIILYYFMGQSKKEDFIIYDYNIKEYAKSLGVSANCIRMRRRRGLLEGEYEFREGKYFYREPSRARENQVITTGHLTTKLGRKINRGAHETSKNPRYLPQLRARNEAVKLASLKYKISPEIQDRLPRAIEIAHNEYREDLRKLEESNKPKLQRYTNGIFNESNKGYDDMQYHSGRAHEVSPRKFRATNRGKDWTKKEYY